jgi:hypothetical protein
MGKLTKEQIARIKDLAGEIEEYTTTLKFLGEQCNVHRCDEELILNYPYTSDNCDYDILLREGKWHIVGPDDVVNSIIAFCPYCGKKLEGGQHEENTN